MYRVFLRQLALASEGESYFENVTTTNTSVRFATTVLAYSTYTASVVPFTSAGAGEEAANSITTGQKSRIIDRLEYSYL